MAKKKQLVTKNVRKKPSQLVCDTVSVICPDCGDCQPSPSDGSDYWTLQEIERAVGERQCVSCDSYYLLTPFNKVTFQ